MRFFNNSRVLICVCIFSFLAMNSKSKEELLQLPPHYKLKVSISPEQHSLTVEGSIKNFPRTAGEKFFLNEHFDLFEIDSETQKKIAFEIDRKAASLPYISVSKPVILKNFKGDAFNFKYTGKIPDFVFDVNTIRSDLVELALYANWFPYFPEAANFTYDIEITVPKNFVTTTNGELIGRKGSDQQTTTHWRSTAPSKDIPIIASPAFQKIQVKQKDLILEMLYVETPELFVKLKMAEMGEALNKYKNLLGPAAQKGFLRFIHSPRAGWGYSRLPAVIVSEKQSIELTKDKIGTQKDFHRGMHEIAHFWWSIAEVSNAEDWLNEALAEYTSFAIASQKFGADFTQAMLSQYRDDIKKSKQKISVLQTEADSPDRYVNRYEKTTLMLLHVEKLVGQQKMFAFLKMFYMEFKGTRKANTKRFLDLCDTALGHEPRTYLETKLNATDWTEN